MWHFILRRAGAALLLLLLISFGTFCLLALAPGDPIQLLLTGTSSTPSPATIHALREQYHLNGSFVSRYLAWLGDAVQLHLGRSNRTNETVLSAIGRSGALTLQLAGLSFVLVLLAGLPLGVWSALRRGKPADRAVVSGSILAVSAPPFATATLLLFVFAVALPWFPGFGAGGGGLDRLRHLVLPAFALALTAVAVIVRITRTAMMRELEQDYVVFAAARAVPQRRIVWRYAFRNALIPIVTASGLVLGYMVSGAVLVEVAFSLPGLGSLLVTSANYKDVPMLQGVVIVLGAVILAINLLVDVLYAVIDPRVRLGSAGDG